MPFWLDQTLVLQLLDWSTILVFHLCYCKLLLFYSPRVHVAFLSHFLYQLCLGSTLQVKLKQHYIVFDSFKIIFMFHWPAPLSLIQHAWAAWYQTMAAFRRQWVQTTMTIAKARTKTGTHNRTALLITVFLQDINILMKSLSKQCRKHSSVIHHCCL